MPARAYDGGPGGHRHEHGRAPRRGQAPLGGGGQHPAERGGQRERARAPCGPGPWRAAGRRTPPRRSTRPARPGTASGAPGRPAVGSRAAHVSGTASDRAAEQPTQPPPWTRSSQASSTGQPCLEAAAPRGERDGALWRRPTRGGCGCEPVSGRRRRPTTLELGARPGAVVAEGVEPLVGGDQPQRQAECRARPPSPGRRRGRRWARPGRASTGEPSAETKLTSLVSPVGRVSTASVAGSRQPTSTIRAASLPAVEEGARAAGAGDDPLVGAQDVDDPQRRGRRRRRTPRRGGCRRGRPRTRRRRHR